MKTLHCPNCGTPFVRVAPQSGMVERVLQHLNVVPFRCQLCMNKFHAFSREATRSAQASDRRQYKRLLTSIQAQFLADWSAPCARHLSGFAFSRFRCLISDASAKWSLACS
jgi:hypothetical protein